MKIIDIKNKIFLSSFCFLKTSLTIQPRVKAWYSRCRSMQDKLETVIKYSF